MKFKFNLLDRVQKIPGGMMLIPMAIAAIINTWLPDLLQIGSPFSATFSSKGTMCIVGMMIVFTGIQIRPEQLVHSVKRGGILMTIKILVGIIIGILIMHVFGKDGIWGISALAWIACLTSCNPGLYIALMKTYGDEIDCINFVPLGIIGLPFVPICIIGFANREGIAWMSILATILPLMIGLILGCVDNKIRDFAKDGISLLIPFMGFCLGSNINLNLAVQSVGTGFIILVVFMLTNFVPLYVVDRKILHQRGHSAAAISCVAGLAMTVPGLMVEKDASYAPYLNAASAQIAFVVVLSAIITPILVKRIAERNQEK